MGENACLHRQYRGIAIGNASARLQCPQHFCVMVWLMWALLESCKGSSHLALWSYCPSLLVPTEGLFPPDRLLFWQHFCTCFSGSYRHYCYPYQALVRSAKRSLNFHTSSLLCLKNKVKEL